MNVPKEVVWVRSSRKDLLTFPKDAQREIGYAIYAAQIGEKAASAKPLKGFGGGSVLEVVENDDGDTYRAVYTVRFEERVYILHCFQKKSTHGIKTSQQDMELIRTRLKDAEELHIEWRRSKGKE